MLLRNQELVDAALEGLVIAKDGKIVNVNRRILQLTQPIADRAAGQERDGRSCS